MGVRKGFSCFYVDHARVTGNTSGPSRTRQEFAAECDINTIMIKYEATGVISHFNNGEPRYLDLTDMPDTLEGTLAMLREAESAFMTLPAHVRREFENSPVAFVDYASDPKNISQMRDWGLAPPAALPDAVRESGDATPVPAPPV
ncbi:internal scaffolding protein [robinz microvirus RP_92]|nr:internal scaffolding protein [robinz microvirus RP_92]